MTSSSKTRREPPPPICIHSSPLLDLSAKALSEPSLRLVCVVWLGSRFGVLNRLNFAQCYLKLVSLFSFLRC